MTSSSSTDPTLIGIFEAEVGEAIGAFHEHLLQIEQGAPDRHQRLETLLRLAHDLKGSARVVGYEGVARLAHALEHRLLSWRRRERVDSADVDVALRATDALRELSLRPMDEALSALAEARIDELHAGGAPAAGTPAPAPGAALPPRAPLAALDPHAPPVPRASGEASAPHGLAVRAAAPPAPGLPLPSSGPAAPHADTLRVARSSIETVTEAVATTLFDSQRADEHLEELASALSALEAVRLPRPSAGPREIARAFGELRDAMARLRSQSNALRDTLRQAQGNVRTLDGLSRALCLVPATPLVVHLERVARDAASALGRRVEVTVTGRDLHVDMTVLEALKGPLTHAVRNAVDHGLEPADERVAAGKPPVGALRLCLVEEGDSLRVSVEDDGRGVDRAAVRARLGERAHGLDDRQLLQALLRSGLSTREQVTQLSGRGLGLGALAVVADQLRGDAELASVAGRGSTITLRLPRRLSLVTGAVVEAGGSLFVVPLACIAGVEADVPQARDLAAMLGLPAAARPAPTLVLKGRDSDVPFAVTGVGEPVEVVRRSVGAHLGRVDFVEGATILPGGRPAFILDARALAAACGGAALSAHGPGARARRRVLLVDDSPTLRAKLHQDLSTAGFEIVLAEDGLMALERLAAQPCDAVVSDVQMPRLDGFQLLARCGAQVPVVLVTAWPDQVAEVRARELGAAAYIPKDHQLAERVVRALHAIPALAPESAP